MSSLVFALFVVAFVVVGLAWVLEPREMMRWNVRARYGTDAEIEPTDTRVLTGSTASWR